MECHYKVLGVDLKADDETIKKAYRKAALRYHPDKNPDCLEEATERFRLVQAAYEVLSDPQERAWYDRHREEILHRKKYENYKDNSIDLWEYFSPSAYRGFGDDERGFYAVYRDVFRKIDAEDEPFRTEDSDDNDPMPIFGDGESDYDDFVHVFYSSWQAYRTHLSFVWENQYDVKEAPNRRVARMIEKENKKERDKHKKKRNELVRELVAYVRKRDPRVKAHRAELERIAEEQAQKAEERRASALREKVEKAAEYDEANKEEMMKHHERVAALEDMMKDEFGFSTSEDDDEDSQKEDEEEEEYKDELFCVACNKLFKSDMGLRNHQKSKKHKENVNRLQEEMKEEQNGADSHEETVSVDTSTIENLEEDSKNSKLSKKQKKQKRQQQKLLNNMMSAEPLKVEDLGNSEQVDTSENQFEKEESAENDQQSENQVEEISNEIPEVENEILSEDLQPEENITVVDESDVTENPKTQNVNGQNGNKRTIHKQKKQKQQPTKSDLSSEQLNCGKCSLVFKSRNKLFQHLKQTGHSLPLEGGKPKRKDKRTRKLERSTS